MYIHVNRRTVLIYNGVLLWSFVDVTAGVVCRAMMDLHMHRTMKLWLNSVRRICARAINSQKVRGSTRFGNQGYSFQLEIVQTFIMAPTLS
jgi:hypothetical protein